MSEFNLVREIAAIPEPQRASLFAAAAALVPSIPDDGADGRVGGTHQGIAPSDPMEKVHRRFYRALEVVVGAWLSYR